MMKCVGIMLVGVLIVDRIPENIAFMFHPPRQWGAYSSHSQHHTPCLLSVRQQQATLQEKKPQRLLNSEDNDDSADGDVDEYRHFRAFARAQFPFFTGSCVGGEVCVHSDDDDPL